MGHCPKPRSLYMQERFAGLRPAPCKELFVKSSLTSKTSPVEKYLFVKNNGYVVGDGAFDVPPQSARESEPPSEREGDHEVVEGACESGGFEDWFGTFYMSLIPAGSLRLLLRKIHLPPGGRRIYPRSNANIYFPRNFLRSSAGRRDVDPYGSAFSKCEKWIFRKTCG